MREDQYRCENKLGSGSNKPGPQVPHNCRKDRIYYYYLTGRDTERGGEGGKKGQRDGGMKGERERERMRECTPINTSSLLKRPQ